MPVKKIQAQKAALDTDTLSAIMRRDAKALAKANEYLKSFHKLSFSSITEYEIRRGLEYKRATSQINKFNQLRASSNVLPISDQVIKRAAVIHAELRRNGQLISDADILIAAAALERSWRVVSNNLRHFNRIDGLTAETWLG